MGLYSKEPVFRVICVFHITEVTGKILSNRNTCIVLLFYRLHGDIVLIVIVTIIDTVTVIVLSQ